MATERSAPGPGATADELFAFADQLEAEGRLVTRGPVAEKQQDAPGALGPYASSQDPA